ncbi:MAG: proteasome subunit beta [Halobacteriales archaeon]|nr:proteasome subunit beta [Halobacteriales archaeon]
MARDHQASIEAPPGRTPGWQPLHETDPPVPNRSMETADGDVNETGTTIVALQTAESVVLAADRRASLGGRFVTNKRVQKIEDVHPTAALALSGAVGHIQRFTRMLRAEAALYEQRRDDRMSIDALSTLAGNVLGSMPLYVSPLLGGVDEQGPHVITLDGGGGVLSDTYAAGGSGMQVAYGLLERQYEVGLSIEDAQSVAGRAIEGATERDTASGNGLTVATVTDEGVDIDEYDDIEAVI